VLSDELGVLDGALGANAPERVVAGEVLALLGRVVTDDAMAVGGAKAARQGGELALDVEDESARREAARVEEGGDDVAGRLATARGRDEEDVAVLGEEDVFAPSAADEDARALAGLHE